MTNTNKLKEVAKIDYNLQSYIKKHIEVLMSVGHTEEKASTLILYRLTQAIESVDNEEEENLKLLDIENGEMKL